MTVWVKETKMDRRWLWFTASAVALLTAVLLAIVGVSAFNASLTKGLEEEKSYTRHAMKFHRTHPDQRKGDNVLEVWSDSDYIAHLAAQQNTANPWAAWSDSLTFLPEKIRKRDGRPYCVIESPPDTTVIWFLSPASLKCNVTGGFAPISNIRSGDLEFSGRQDYWIYLLKGK
jgi:hypothetical protein